MALICVAVHDTEDNGRTEYTSETLASLLENVALSKHRIVVIDNGSCESTKHLLNGILAVHKQAGCVAPFTLITNAANVGTAKAINQGLALRQPGEYCIKMDNDVVIQHWGWADEMEETMRRMPELGILGLKRKDLEQRPNHEISWYQSQLVMVPQQKGERWYVVEETADIMGTCTMFSPQILDKIGGLRQPGVYGWDDVDYSIRSRTAGFRNAFLPHIEIEHIDAGGDGYSEWKRKVSGESGQELQRYKAGYANGTMDLYQPIV